MNKRQLQPFENFGLALKKLRESHKKSLHEVSGALEIHVDELNQFEAGERRPAEDVLFLIIQHFSLKDDKADELWRLAGYEKPYDHRKFFMNDDMGEARELEVAIDTEDTRIVYTDMVQVMINNYGVVMNFMQGAGVHHQPLAVARVGMSKEHAQSIIKILQETLKQAETMQSPKAPKQLSAGQKKPKKD